MKQLRDELLWKYALRRINKSRSIVIAVGGGIAKTSTKHAIGTVLTDQFKDVLVGFGNLNTYLGVPLSILEFKIDFHHQRISWQWPFILLQAWLRSFKVAPKYLVLEYGTDRPGDIEKITSKLPPTIAVLTLVAPAHVMNYGSLEAVANDEGRLVEAVSENGVVFLNKRDPFYSQHLQRIKTKQIIDVDVPNEEIALGFARAVGQHFSIPQEHIEASLLQMKSPAQRFNQRTIGDWLVIDDTYNANPASMEGALNLLAKTTGRKVAILGTMKELGEQERYMHQAIGERARQVADVVIGVGEFTEEYQPVIKFNDSETAAREIFSYLKKGDSILVKGSRSIQMEKIITAIENAVA